MVLPAGPGRGVEEPGGPGGGDGVHARGVRERPPGRPLPVQELRRGAPGVRHRHHAALAGVPRGCEDGEALGLEERRGGLTG